jgi:glucose 1-dehydrogenase
MQGIQGKHVLVTGGSSGIGQAIAVRLGREGASVAINYRKNIEEAQQTEALINESLDRCVGELQACGAKHTLVQADVSREDEIVQMVATTVRDLGGLDILINNAGIQIPADSHEMTADQFDRVINVNVRGAFLCAREAIKHFLAGGRPG